jgi:uncharacterized membrane protein
MKSLQCRMPPGAAVAVSGAAAPAAGAAAPHRRARISAVRAARYAGDRHGDDPMSPRRRPHETPPPPPRRDFIVAALAVAGFAISAYLTFTKLTGATAAFCEAGTGCDIVQASRYATFLWAPTPAWGALLYAALAALALVGLTPVRWLWAFVLATAATAFSAYLTWIAAFELRALCPWCLTAAAIAVLSLVALLLTRPSATGRRAPTRPARVATIGVATAIVTIVFAAGVFVMDPATGGSAYAAQLAKHLAATDGVMYGAFW